MNSKCLHIVLFVLNDDRVNQGKMETKVWLEPQVLQETEEKMEYLGRKVHQAQRSVAKH